MAFDARNLSGISILAAVVEGGSFVKAAELIGITDSGASRAVSRLEKRLGIRLLDRTTRTVSLTDEGRRLYEEVKPHLDGIEHATMTASGAVSAVRGRLKGDIDPFFLPAVLGGRLGTFCERHPDFSEMRAAMRPVTQRIAQIKREGEQELKSLQNEGQPLAS